MGLSCISLNFKGAFQPGVVRAFYHHLPLHKSYVSPQLNGWVTALDSDCESLADDVIVNTAGTISRVCNCPSICLGVLHSDYLFYWLFNNLGQLIDQSFPSDPPTIVEQSGLAGQPELIADLANQRATGDHVRHVLSRPSIYRDENLYALADLLGINKTYVSLSYDYIVRTTDILDQTTVPLWDQFIYVES
jgi:hypothetical protein